MCPFQDDEIVQERSPEEIIHMKYHKCAFVHVHVFQPFSQMETTFVTSCFLSKMGSTLNYVALRKANIVYNFDLSECKGIKEKNLNQREQILFKSGPL